MTKAHLRVSWRIACAAAASLLLGATVLAAATWHGLRDFPQGLDVAGHETVKPTVLARDGTPLSMTLENAWNSDTVPLSAMPPLLVTAFIVSEDQHFTAHHGVDWLARGAAFWQDLRALAPVRGASTITEQVVRMLHPRPRSVWSRWLEGFEARRLEAGSSKIEILEFYLNQVPYAERRRGVNQAAQLYFDRSLDTLTPGELLSLAVLVRSPVRMDLRRDPARAAHAVAQLAARLQDRGVLTSQELRDIQVNSLGLSRPPQTLQAGYFVGHVLDTLRQQNKAPRIVRTTLDQHFQARTQEILAHQLEQLARRKVRDGGVLVIDHANNEIIAWVVGHNATPGAPPDGAGRGIDSILVPRQPGSTLKPLLYAMALERGWTPATLIEDSDLSESVGGGLHTFHNYSHVHYGPIRLREALGNSLNIPAIRTLKFVGHEQFLARLRETGIHSLAQHPDFYGDGLALGNGEISLFEMAQAYTVLARHGRFLPLTMLADDRTDRPETKINSAEVAMLIGDILSDPEARTREFGSGLRFPIETAIKTGTSTDYRDAWAIAYDYRHTVAVWMGNLDGTATDGVTGAVGPAMVLRSVFSELNRNQETRGLGARNGLIAARICRVDGRPANDACESIPEWFIPGSQPSEASPKEPMAARETHMLLPTPGLQVAHDPRIPAELEALPMQIATMPGLTSVDWYVDGELASRTSAPKFSWPLIRGAHEVYSRIWLANRTEPVSTEPVKFYVR
jgi:penicillin-binding protein 1C